MLINQRETCRGTTDDVLCVRELNVSCTANKKTRKISQSLVKSHADPR